MATFRGYEPNTVQNADLKVGDMMYNPGAGMLCPIVAIAHRSDGLVIDLEWESFGRRRISRKVRKPSGKSTIHVRTVGTTK